MRQYSLILGAAFMAAVAAVVLLNVLVDARGVYRLGGAAEQVFVERYVARLRVSKNGLVSIAQDRLAKLELARLTAADCYVQGSSHVMQIDAVTAPQLFAGCGEVINLGVAGSSFEDFVAMAGLLAGRNFRGQLVIGVGPWMMRRQADTRWKEYAAAYETGRKVLGLPPTFGAVLAVDSRWIGAVNADYAIYNAKHLLRRRVVPDEPAIVRTLNEAVEATAAKDQESTIMPNGRFRYSRDFLSKAPPPPQTVGDGKYKIEGGVFLEPIVAAEFEQAIEALVRNGARVTLLLTPYHPSVMSCKGQNVCLAMREVETAMRSLAVRQGVPLIGSYDPRPLGLTWNDFLDAMHIAEQGLSRLVRVEPNPWAAAAP